MSSQVNYIAQVKLIYPTFLGTLLVFYPHGKAFSFLALQGQERFVNHLSFIIYFLHFYSIYVFHDIPSNSFTKTVLLFRVLLYLLHYPLLFPVSFCIWAFLTMSIRLVSNPFSPLLFLLVPLKLLSSI